MKKQRFWEIFSGVFAIIIVLGMLVTIVVLGKIRYEEYRQEYSVASEQLTLEVESFSVRDDWFKVNTIESSYYTRTFTYSTDVDGMYVVLTKKPEMNIWQFVMAYSFSTYQDDIYSVVVIIGSDS